MIEVHRHDKRLPGQRIGNAKVALTLPGTYPCTLLDISVGGLKLLFDGNAAAELFTPGKPIEGKIVGEAPSFQIAFSGKIIWNRASALMGEPATLAGVAFADYTPLPDALMHLIEDLGAAD